jgi:hypothetical protein
MADSILKDLYTDIKTAVDSITGIDTANIDLYKNQIAGLTAFPSVLIDFPYIYYKDASAKVQMGNAMVRVLLCLDATSVTLPADIFETKDKIYEKLQGLKNLKCSPLSRGSERVETKYITTGTDIYVFEMDFYTVVQDDGVYRYKTFVDASPVALKMERGVIAAEVGGVNDGVEQGIVNEMENDIIRTGKIV